MNNLNRCILLLFGLSVLCSCAQKAVDYPKINGVSFVASPKEVQQVNILPLQAIHANYAAIMPFGFIKTLDHPEIVFNTERQWFGETNDGAKQYITKLHENNISVMLKPQIWIWRGEFTGNLKMKSEANWKLLEEAYRLFILDFARLAEETHVAMFCIGTELEQFIVHRPAYWTDLIAEIRSIYHGKLTYAANWDEYKRVPFWDQLDYIGVDAYFPISENQTPSLEEARIGWQPWLAELKEMAKAHNKKVVFAEYGYRSVDFAGKEPWKSDLDMSVVNQEAQSNLTRALFAEVWDQEWFAGGFIWKWFIDHKAVGGIEDSQFTPQNKPAEAVVRETYATSN
ncbi:MAG: glycoside hydrolase [Altibacter sp.]|uniref:glycoside hydrolase family 113 n=1 Tax=Altibacter sp. TaxID=2024823 RepID=UPI001D679DFF|nr:glycoside hydrolase [Altibacter sp.]MBZ0326760.1 glycoside hydrolase [Altibacter sp.]